MLLFCRLGCPWRRYDCCFCPVESIPWLSFRAQWSKLFRRCCGYRLWFLLKYRAIERHRNHFVSLTSVPLFRHWCIGFDHGIVSFHLFYYITTNEHKLGRKILTRAIMFGRGCFLPPIGFQFISF